KTSLALVGRLAHTLSVAILGESGRRIFFGFKSHSDLLQGCQGLNAASPLANGRMSGRIFRRSEWFGLSCSAEDACAPLIFRRGLRDHIAEHAKCERDRIASFRLSRSAASSNSVVTVVYHYAAPAKGAVMFFHWPLSCSEST